MWGGTSCLRGQLLCRGVWGERNDGRDEEHITIMERDQKVECIQSVDSGGEMDGGIQSKSVLTECVSICEGDIHSSDEWEDDVRVL